MSRQIDYYFSLTSPWAYIGHAVFEDVASTYDCSVNYKPVILPSGAAALSDVRAAALA
jgi:2-hydroxychromene-2-carboxylate isomerase